MLVDELASLKLLAARENWEKYGRRVPIRALSDNAGDLVADIAYYFQTNECTAINWDAFATWHKQERHPNKTPADRALLDAIIARVKEYEPDPAVIAALQSAWAKAGLLQDAAELLMQLRTGQSDEAPDTALLRLVEAYRAGAGQADTAGPASLALTEQTLAASTSEVTGDGYEWGLEDLNVGIGPLRPGDYVLIGGRPEIGKTSIVVCETAHMLYSRDASALWINNEEGSHRILLRYLSVVLGRPAKELRNDIKGALAEMYKRGWTPEQLRVFDAHGADLAAIEDEIERVNPTFLILHRLDKMPQVRNNGKNSNEVQRIADLAFWGRKQASAGRVVIGVVQADTSAVGHKFVYDHQLYGSKTALQAETDVILAVGAEQVFDETRGICISRNKLVGGPRSSETKRHGFFDVKFDHVTGRYETILYKGPP